jgi:hypothetical protein
VERFFYLKATALKRLGANRDATPVRCIPPRRRGPPQKSLLTRDHSPKTLFCRFLVITISLLVVTIGPLVIIIDSLMLIIDLLVLTISLLVVIIDLLVITIDPLVVTILLCLGGKRPRFP